MDDNPGHQHLLPETAMPDALENHPELRVLVLGGTGFIGRHAVQALNASGAKVLIGSRRPALHASAYLYAIFRLARFENLTTPDAWAVLLSGVDLVVNCVGILRQRPHESYDVVHHRAPAAACTQARVRLIHTSALGLHEGARSRFLSSKLLGEQAVMASGANYSIVCPSLLDGSGGFGASWLRGLSRSPVHFIPRGARGSIAAMTATDLGKAFVALSALQTLADHREVELGGTRHYGYAEYLRTLRANYTASKALQIPIPDWLARLSAHVCDGLHFSPFSYGHWILLQRNNIAVPNRLPQLLGRAPCAIGRTSESVVS